MTNKRKSGVLSPQMLTRSRIEIARVLGALASARSAVSAYLESGELLFYAHIREVDAVADRVVMNYGVSKPANTALLSRKKIAFHSDHGNMHVKFLAVSPVHNKYDGESAIQLRFPDYLVQHEQRSQPRIKIPSQFRAQCVVERPGYLSSAMEIVDISRTGLGILVPDSDIKFESGSVLTDCRIKHPMCPSISVTLKVLFVGKRRLADGRLQARVGCQIIGDAADVAELVSMFSIDL